MIGCQAIEFRHGFRRVHLRDVAQTRSENGDSANHLRMADGHLHSRGTAKALAEEVGLWNLEVFQESCDIVSVVLERYRAIDVRRTSVPLNLDGDQLPISDQRGINARQTQPGVDRDTRV